MKSLVHCSNELNGFFQGFGFGFEVKEVESMEELSKEVNDLVTCDISEFQRIFVFVFSHGCYDRISDRYKIRNPKPE
jgi:hypothetical protein